MSSCHSEITYGLERLASYIQEVESVYDLEWTQGVKYGEILFNLNMNIQNIPLKLVTKKCF